MPVDSTFVLKRRSVLLGTERNRSSRSLPARLPEDIRRHVPLEIVRWRHPELLRSGQRPQLWGEVVRNHRWTGRAAPVDIFPDDLAIGFYLEEPSRVVLSYVCIAIGKPLLGSHTLAEEPYVRVALRLIDPDDLLSYRIQLYDEGLASMGSMPREEPVVEQNDVAGPGKPLLDHLRFVGMGQTTPYSDACLPRRSPCSPCRLNRRC